MQMRELRKRVREGILFCAFYGRFYRGDWRRDAGWRNFFLLMFRFQKAGSSKFSASRGLAADGPAPDALALLAAVSGGAGRRLLGTSRFYNTEINVSPNPGY